MLVLALFLGATVQYSYGSIYVGIFFIILAIILLSRLKTEKAIAVKLPKFYAIPKFYTILGLLILISDIVYNYTAKSELGTIDTMTFILGSSLIAYDVNNDQARKMGLFGACMSASFIILYIIFYNILNEYLYIFDSYFVMTPSVYLGKALGLPLEIVATETLKMYGGRDLEIRIGGPCSGLYSMFLLLSIIIGYSITENIRNIRRLIGIGVITALIAYIANFFRVTTLYIVAYFYGYDAMMTAHVHLGWILFAVTSLIVVYLLSKIEYFSPKIAV